MSDSESEPTSPSEASEDFAYDVEEVVKTPEEDPEEPPTIEGSIKEAIHKSLSNVQGTGSFAVFEKLGTPPLPGLHLNQGGNIGLPLSDRDAQAIIAESHQAPFGKGEETIVDQSVRKTWELSPDNFELTNPAWKPFVDDIVSKVSTGLGVDAAGRGVSAQLYKLLLYDEGALFKPHQDSEKAPGMFGTLVIALPSKHEGGAVEVTHAGQTKLFETSKFSEFEASYLAWFSDVTHEVKPITSGHRLVLTYNLIHESLGPKDLAASSNNSLAALRAAFRTWNETLENREEDLKVPIATLLEHKYTEASLQLDGLKGKDKQVGSLLRQVCEEFGFCFYLANFEKTISGGCDENDYVGRRGVHEIDELIDDRTTLLKIVELDGTELGKNLNFEDEAHMDRSDTFTKRVRPDKEEYSGYTGNEGVSTTHFYRRTLAIMMPKSHRVDFFLDPKNQKNPDRSYMYCWSADKPENVANPAVDTWLDQLSQKFSADSQNQSAREDLTAICQLMCFRTEDWNQKLLFWRENEKKDHSAPGWRYHAKPSATPPFSFEHLARGIRTALELDNRDLLVKMFNSFLELENPPLLKTLLLLTGVALARYDGDFGNLLKLRLSKINAFHSRISKLLTLREAAIAEGKIIGNNPARYETWADKIIRDALNSPDFAMDVAEDGAALVAISKLFEPKDIFKTILSTVKINIDRTPMVVAFLTGLFNAGTSGEIDKEVTRNVFRDVISSLAEQFSLKSLESSLESKRAKTVGRGRYLYGPPSRQPAPPIAEADDQNSRNIATLLCNCLELNLPGELGQICEKMTTEVKTADVELFEVIYLPFLKQLSGMLPVNNSSAELSTLFQIILSTYIIRYVKAEPQPPNHWSREPVEECSCADHALLTAFLRDATRKEGRFSMAKKRRDHINPRYMSSKGLKTDTDTSRSPHTLVVTKTLEVHNDAHQAWQYRCMIARNHIKAIGDDSKLSTLLGDKKDAITLLDFESLRVMYPDALAQIEPLGASSSGGNRTLALPKKPRKTGGSVPVSAEVIELD